MMEWIVVGIVTTASIIMGVVLWSTLLVAVSSLQPPHAYRLVEQRKEAQR